MLAQMAASQVLQTISTFLRPLPQEGAYFMIMNRLVAALAQNFVHEDGCSN